MTTARPTVRLAAAGATVLALGAAACGPPDDLEVDGGLAQPEPAPAEQRPAEPSSASTSVAPASEDLGTPMPGETPPEPDALEPTSEDTATNEPAEEATAAPQEPTQPATTSPTLTEPPTEEPEAEPIVLEHGDQGEHVLALQQQLADLGYWVATTDGDYGHLTEQAVLAFQGWEGLTRDGVVGPRTRDALTSASRPVPEGGGDGIEIHLAQQVLLVVRDGRTRLALHTSTGSGETYTRDDGSTALADTPTGTWEIAWRVDGWRESDLGRLYRPVYFHEDGLAVHGYPEVPSYPASHGCARVSMAAMDMLWAEGNVTEGTRVVVT